MIIDKDTDLDKFWLVKDGLHLTNNLYFGLGQSYFCDHGCKVCYIRDELKGLKPSTNLIYNNDLGAMQKSWDEMFSFFNGVCLDEDPYFLKYNHPKEFNWYIENAGKCNYGTTDNGILRISKLKQLKFKAMSEVALSISFIEKVGEDKILKVLDTLGTILRLKFLIDVVGSYPTKIIAWAKKKDMPIVIHKTEFLSGNETEFDLTGFEQVQDVNWVVGRKGNELVKIHIEYDTILYYNNFYFSNNTGDTPFYTMDENGFNYKLFLSSMLESKQRYYLKYASLVDDEYVKNYFLNTQNYKINHNFNFIPNFMINYNVQFFHRMKDYGWVPTKYGMILNGTTDIIPIIEKK